VTKLRNLFAVALVMLPAVTLNAGPLPSAETRPGLSSTQPVAGTCWYFMGGRWWEYPC
jgi:hypothetical protein